MVFMIWTVDILNYNFRYTWAFKGDLKQSHHNRNEPLGRCFGFKSGQTP